MDMVIQAGSLLSDIPRQIPAAGADLIKLLNQFDRILHCPRTGIGTKIPDLVLFHRAAKKESAGYSSPTVTLMNG